MSAQFTTVLPIRIATPPSLPRGCARRLGAETQVDDPVHVPRREAAAASTALLKDELASLHEEAVGLEQGDQGRLPIPGDRLAPPRREDAGQPFRVLQRGA